jgi:hypothetical protein
MNVSLRRDLEFLAGFYIPSQPKEKLQCNRYKIDLHLVTATEDCDEINIAMDRIKAMVYYNFSHTVFVNSQHREDIAMMQDLGINITTLPEEPLDQVVGVMLYCKLSAVVERRMQILQLDIASELGDMVWYQHFSDDNLGPFADGGWWHHASTQHSDVIKDSSEIPSIPAGSWSQYDLAWNAADTGSPNTVVYVDFRRDEN